MKIKKILIVLLFFVFFIVGCTDVNKTNIIDKMEKKISELKSYQLQGELEIVNNENSYLYDVNVMYLKENNFKVSLKNKTNNHEQIILRNEDGVYVITHQSLQQKII